MELFGAYPSNVEINGVKYYNDSKGTNVDATVTAVNAFDSPVILLAGGFEKELSFEPLKPLLPKSRQKQLLQNKLRPPMLKHKKQTRL